MKLDTNKSMHLVTVQAFDLDAGTATFEDDGWELSVQQPNLRQALTGIKVGEPVVITVFVSYDDLRNPYRLAEVHWLGRHWKELSEGC